MFLRTCVMFLWKCFINTVWENIGKIRNFQSFLNERITFYIRHIHCVFSDNCILTLFEYEVYCFKVVHESNIQGSYPQILHDTNHEVHNQIFSSQGLLVLHNYRYTCDKLCNVTKSIQFCYMLGPVHCLIYSKWQGSAIYLFRCNISPIQSECWMPK